MTLTDKLTQAQKEIIAYREWKRQQSAAQPMNDITDKLAKALEEAVEDIEAWAAYASDYFKDKHDLEGDLSGHRATLAEYHTLMAAPPSTTPSKEDAAGLNAAEEGAAAKHLVIDDDCSEEEYNAFRQMEREQKP